MVSGCDRELNAHFYSAASLKYHVPDTWHDSASTIFYDFDMSRPGIEPVTSHSPERTLYQLSYRGRFQKCKIFVIQGQVTPKLVVWSGPKSNLDKLLCLSWLPATLMMIQ